MITFLEQVTTLLEEHVGPGKFRIVDSKDYPKFRSAHVDVSLTGVFLQILKDRNTDFWINVASPSEPGKFHGLRVLLLLISGQPIERSRVMVGHDMDAIGKELGELMVNYEAICGALAAETWPETKRRLSDMGKQLMHPAIRSALERARK